jgi:flagellar hook-associated protein 1 FlgK
MSDFAGLRLALSALQAQQRGVQTAAQNVANANTEGYSRQRVDLESVGAPAVPAFWSKYNGEGMGVRVAEVTRFRDQFLEIRAAIEHGANASLAQGSRTMTRIEQLFNEPSDDGMAKQLSEFWSGFDDIANHPEEQAPRAQLLERAQTLVRSLNQASDQLTQMRNDTISELGATVTDINALSAQIAELNASIKANTVSGLNTNELKDKRDLLANKLAEESGATIRTFEFGQVNIVLNGTALVQENHSNTVSLDTSGANAVIRWDMDNSVATVDSGTAGGKLDAINTTIPAYLTRLNTVATTLRDQVNPLHSGLTGSIATTAQDQTATGNLVFQLALNGGGYANVTVAGADWSGAGGAAALQTAFQTAVNTAIGAGNATVAVSGGTGSAMSVTLTPTGTNTLLAKASGANTGFSTLLGTSGVGADGVGGRKFFTGTTAANIAIDAGVAGNPDAVVGGVANGGAFDGSRALDLADEAESLTGADSTYRTLIVQLGVDTSTAATRSDIQDKATQSLDNARAQASGVSLDEEMTNLVQYQHAYEAAARFMSAIDEMLDTLVNRTGR